MGQRRNPSWSAVALASLFLAGCAISARPAMSPVLPQAALVEAAGRRKPPRPPQVAENVIVKATVVQLLPDDNQGSPHQLFVVGVAGRRIRVAHNTELAPKVPLAVGSAVEIRGDYIKSKPIDVLHWTHHDPAGKHVDGYVLFNGRYYK